MLERLVKFLPHCEQRWRVLFLRMLRPWDLEGASMVSWRGVEWCGVVWTGEVGGGGGWVGEGCMGGFIWWCRS